MAKGKEVGGSVVGDPPNMNKKMTASQCLIKEVGEEKEKRRRPRPLLCVSGITAYLWNGGGVGNTQKPTPQVRKNPMSDLDYSLWKFRSQAKKRRAFRKIKKCKKGVDYYLIMV